MGLPRLGVLGTVFDVVATVAVAAALTALVLWSWRLVGLPVADELVGRDTALVAGYWIVASIIVMGRPGHRRSAPAGSSAW